MRIRRQSVERITAAATAAACIALATPVDSTAQDAAAAVRAARQWRQDREPELLRSYVEFLRIPNVSRDLPNIRRNAEYLINEMGKRGMSPRLLTDPNVPPVVYGELLSPNATHTYVFYAHYDGQPVDPKEWTTAPFEPTLNTGRLDKGGKVVATLPTRGSIDPEWRIYARSASDDKAPIFAMLAALDSLKASGVPLKANLKFFFEGEEEILSPHLESILAANKALLTGDLWLVCDGPEHASRLQTVTFGARGAQTIDVTVYGPNHELHSGHYGNWAPNPAMMLAQLLASMKDAEGHVLVDAFYDGMVPLTAAEQQAIREIPNVDAELREDFGLARAEGGGKRLEELINLPSLNVRGMASGRIGDGAANVVPAFATVTLDIRLVKGLQRLQQVERVIAHIRKQGYFVTTVEPDATMRATHPKIAKVTAGNGYDAVRTPMDLPLVQPVIKAVESVRRPVVLQPTLGGSVPLVTIESILSTRTIMIPLANFDNNQHTANENVRIGHLWNAIDTFAALLTMN
jgi:acetylornithine deacetylase/succinyl-diaminopimelate desuccinylase-like protein